MTAKSYATPTIIQTGAVVQKTAGSTHLSDILEAPTWWALPYYHIL